MNMFTSYDNLPEDYIPDNTSIAPTCVEDTLTTTLPRKIRNVYGTLVGYGWDEGEVFDFNLSADRRITVAEDSIVFEQSGMKPDITTVGRIGQRAYNTVDGISWVCVDTSTVYRWEEEDTVVYCTPGKEIILSPDMTDKDLVFEVFNFRWEPLTSFVASGKNELQVKIDKDITKMFKSGIYYGILKVTSNTNTRVLYKTMLAVQ